ncbi:DUF2956 domain-containing protein [Celerinatantimonas diazotrophica]|uniref:DUF2956 family protein n=1 Tax=Celerinatantimonas diazotrophica TaxID=412034 RepID=A0A4R1K5U8_9GAMM|nr:DUF2956 domain-containing protein [Celerinatantimonas diazotrophica]TCK59123.1 DUF2956 family protein [Celerinatantimonas diazotrophica]CAG9297761.1 hypothetical protein CEDIAZO_02952 [Celerinatantimonas diazotrophica]
MAKNTSSPQLNQQAQALAKANQRPGQSKAQTKLVEEGIRKGIEQYKKQQKAKARELDKARKMRDKQNQQQVEDDSVTEVDDHQQTSPKLPWILLGVSWLIFVVYAGIFH